MILYVICHSEPVSYTHLDVYKRQVYGDKLIYDQASGNNLFLTGKPGDPLRYIIPTNPAGYESGWKFDVNRDYLLPIHPGT